MPIASLNYPLSCLQACSSASWVFVEMKFTKTAHKRTFKCADERKNEKKKPQFSLKVMQVSCMFHISIHTVNERPCQEAWEDSRRLQVHYSANIHYIHNAYIQTHIKCFRLIWLDLVRSGAAPDWKPVLHCAIGSELRALWVKAMWIKATGPKPQLIAQVQPTRVPRNSRPNSFKRA